MPSPTRSPLTMPTSLADRIRSHLSVLGWTTTTHTALGSCPFETVTGAKHALAFVADYGHANATVSLTGQYWSEGRNVLEACDVLIARDADDAALGALVARFGTEAVRRIEQSYGVRLARRAAA